MDALNKASLAYAMALANYHFVCGCATEKWEQRAAYDAMCDEQNKLNDVAKAFADTNEFCCVAR
jgi:hypothetical protein